MLNQVYQLVKPKQISIRYEELSTNQAGKVLVKPNYLAICHADQRYYQGRRDPEILKKKMPMAPIHEACGIVVADPSGTYTVGQTVAMIPNQPPCESDEIFYENYREGTYFLSSGFDGFMQEVVSLPLDRIVPYYNVPNEIASLSEFTSVAVHAINRFDQIAHSVREDILIVADGSLAFLVANVLHFLFPDSRITVVGRNPEKLSLFNFVHATYLTNELPENLKFDHAFECAGGQGSEPAINHIIDRIKPQGTIILMGVSDYKVAINTRDVLEKGLTIVGSSRSGRADFITAVEILGDKKIQDRLRYIISVEEPVRSVEDIHRIFAKDLITPFKTVFKWEC
ncbi:alcohol dehydrogenase catalytic domain-containing protein [Streptococcus sp. 121]|uniref:alcohol dehydrogenase catalytic domain-containing protein n=1 Tax=Streptococcus sp. 121 TaxID=2797637 RepID=UPI0018F0E789|nr:alcohol dehydrogenase catalytic domain-containing protein [Streptococcus sp. 121]MBJ6746084.1 alcohol dehydrogenase catalytic domain-containing protein [Streptococcus sp. 121]